jgi:hypothetical protein
MKQNLFFFALLLGFLTACDQPSKAPEVTVESTTAEQPDSVLRHVVMFQFKATATPSDIKTVEEAFRKLPAQIPEIKSFEFGTNNSPEGLNQGLTHCFLLSFASEKDRAVYLPHPAHKAFGEVLTPFLEKVCVVDYWASK